jgi:hypothetical protein
LGYRSYIHRKESAAQFAFAENMTLYRKLCRVRLIFGLRLNKKVRLTTNILAFFNGALSPYDLKQIHWLSRLRVLRLLRLSVRLLRLAKESPVMPLYKTKLSLMKIDMQDDALRAQGVDELRKLALDKDNKNNDVSQYYIGLYHWTRNELTEALDIWKNLVASQASEKLAASHGQA